MDPLVDPTGLPGGSAARQRRPAHLGSTPSDTTSPPSHPRTQAHPRHHPKPTPQKPEHLLIQPPWISDPNSSVFKEIISSAKSLSGHPVRTLTPTRDHPGIGKMFVSLHEKGLLRKDNRPLLWCSYCQVHEQDGCPKVPQRTLSLYVKVPVNAGEVREAFSLDSELPPVFFAIWTTSPWSLPLNVAIALHPTCTYSLLVSESLAFLVTSSRVQSFLEVLESSKSYQGTKWTIFTGHESGVSGHRIYTLLNGHPISLLGTKPSKLVLSERISDSIGTGILHVVPAHSEVDYAIGLENNLDLLSDLDDCNKFRGVEHFVEISGLSIAEATPIILDRLIEMDGMIVQNEIEVMLPACNRCMMPMIYRCSKEWYWDTGKIDLFKRCVDSTHHFTVLPKRNQKHIQHFFQNALFLVSNTKIEPEGADLLFCDDCSTYHHTSLACDKCNRPMEKIVFHPLFGFFVSLLDQLSKDTPKHFIHIETLFTHYSISRICVLADLYQQSDTPSQTSKNHKAPQNTTHLFISHLPSTSPLPANTTTLTSESDAKRLFSIKHEYLNEKTLTDTERLKAMKTALNEYELIRDFMHTLSTRLNGSTEQLNDNLKDLNGTAQYLLSRLFKMNMKAIKLLESVDIVSTYDLIIHNLLEWKETYLHVLECIPNNQTLLTTMIHIFTSLLRPFVPHLMDTPGGATSFHKDTDLLTKEMKQYWESFEKLQEMVNKEIERNKHNGKDSATGKRLLIKLNSCSRDCYHVRVLMENIGEEMFLGFMRRIFKMDVCLVFEGELAPTKFHQNLKQAVVISL